MRRVRIIMDSGHEYFYVKEGKDVALEESPRTLVTSVMS